MVRSDLAGRSSRADRRPLPVIDGSGRRPAAATPTRRDTSSGTCHSGTPPRVDPGPSRASTPERHCVATKRVDRDDEDLVRLYLTDIGQYPLLTKDDEVRLAQEIEAGAEARTALESGDKVTPAKKRELRRTAREGEQAERRSEERRAGKECR